MGVSTVVMVPRELLDDLYPCDVSRLLRYHCMSWYSLSDYLRGYPDSYVNRDRCIEGLVSALNDYKECVESPEDFEVSCDAFLKDIFFMVELCSVLNDYSAVLVAETADKTLCDLYRSGYVPISFVFRGKFVKDIEEEYRRDCK